MRIVFVLTSLGMGGAERQALALATRMAERGHAVAVMVLRPRLAEEWPTSLAVVHLDMRRNLFSVSAGLVKARRLLREFNPDLLHSHSFHANLVARLLKIFVPRPVVLSTVHNVYEGGRARMLAYHFTDFLSAQTTAVSAAVAERFIRMKAVPQRKCMVISNGIDTTEFSAHHDRRLQMRSAMGVENQFIWLAAGRLVPAKDFPNLLRAFALLRAAHPQTQLWIAGEGNASAAKHLRCLGIEAESFPQVRWLGLRRDLPALLDAADAFVLASAWEGMPLVVGEAMAMEKPVVATDVGGVRELLADQGILVPAHDSPALADGMAAILRMSSKDRASLGSRARQRIAAEFSIAARADQWEALYRNLLSKKR